MAGTSLFALIDDIASILDDVAVLSKVAAKKTAGVLSDDLALNAQQVTGMTPDRELPVVRAVAIGSFKNKAILVPAALAISALLPWAVTVLLMLGGIYLCYEGFEKIIHKVLHSQKGEAHHPIPKGAQNAVRNAANTSNVKVDLVTLEKDKIKGAIRTDFILSAEIIVIALGTVANAPFMKQVVVVIAVAILMTIGVYGIVALIVKLDDLGLYMNKLPGADRFHRMLRSIGRILLVAAPKLMKSLSIIGTAAMFMVGGGILTHGISWVHEWIRHLAESSESISGVGGVLETLLPIALNMSVGMLAGAAAFLMVLSSQLLRSKLPH